jgi:hypothetical protein
MLLRRRPPKPLLRTARLELWRNSSTATTKAPLVHTVSMRIERINAFVVLERQVAEKDALLAQKDAEIATLQAMVRALQLRSSSSIEALVQTPTTRRDPVMTSSPFSLSSSSP